MNTTEPEIPELSDSLFLPLFQSFLEDFAEDPSSAVSIEKKNRPLSCQVFSVDPLFSVSDGFHIVPCEFTKKAVYQFKYWYPTDFLKGTIQMFFLITKYIPIISLNAENKLYCAIRVIEMEYHPEGCKFAPIQGNPIPLAQSPEYANFQQQAILGFLKAQVSFLEVLPAVPGEEPGPEALPLAPIVEPKDFKKNPFDAPNILPAIDYTKIESIEAEVGQEAEAEFDKRKEEKRAKLIKKREETGWVRKKYKKKPKEKSKEKPALDEENKGEVKPDEENKELPEKEKKEKKPKSSHHSKPSGITKEDLTKFKKWKEVISETIGDLPERKRGIKRSPEGLEKILKGKDKKPKIEG